MGARYPEVAPDFRHQGEFLWGDNLMNKSRAYYAAMLRDGFRREICKLTIRLIFMEPGEARRPIYVEIRRLKKWLARADKLVDARRAARL
jgi:hypothetical protein